MTSPLRMPRRRRGTASTLVALLLLLIGGAVAYLAAMKALDRRVTAFDTSPALRAAKTTAWASQAGLYLGVGVAVIGLIVLAAALVPARRQAIELIAPDEVTAAAMTRRGLRRILEARVLSIDGINSASASIGRHVVRLEAWSSLRNTEGLQDAATAVVTCGLEDLNLRHPRNVTTRLHRKER